MSRFLTVVSAVGVAAALSMASADASAGLIDSTVVSAVYGSDLLTVDGQQGPHERIVLNVMTAGPEPAAMASFGAGLPATVWRARRRPSAA